MAHSAGQLGHLAEHDYLVTLGRLGSAVATANQASISAAVDLTSLSVTVNVAAGRRIKITASGLFFSSVSLDVAALLIMESTTQLAGGQAVVGASSNAAASITVTALLTPSAGSHTYKLQGARGSGTGTVTLVASATIPALILVEDIGL